MGASGLGSPVLEGATAWIDCTLHAVHDGGDHLIVVGAVHDLGATGDIPPLVFHRGGYARTPPGRRVSGPLDDVRVLELGTIVAGPFAGRLLADYGADVVKIEPPGGQDPMRDWGQESYRGHRLWWTVHARNKRCITLDLRAERGQELFLRLVEGADVVVENFRPGTLERWNLGWDRLSAVNPGLVLARVSGYGQTGPYADKAGLRVGGRGAPGLRYINGYPGEAPPRMAISLGDSLAGMVAVQGVLAALHHRERSPARARWSTSRSPRRACRCSSR